MFSILFRENQTLAAYLTEASQLPHFPRKKAAVCCDGKLIDQQLTDGFGGDLKNLCSHTLCS
jgi:hypothetical protein